MSITVVFDLWLYLAYSWIQNGHQPIISYKTEIPDGAAQHNTKE